MICTQCGVVKEMTYRQRGMHSAKNPFCSIECSRLWQKANLTKDISDPNGARKCSCCGMVKLRTDFNSKSKSGGLHSYCKKCLYLYQMKRWNKKKIMAVKYKGGKCVKCGLIDHPTVYDFHHPNNDKDTDFSNLRNKKWETIVKEIDKCVLMCSVCHRKEHFNSKLWPEMIKPAQI